MTLDRVLGLEGWEILTYQENEHDILVHARPPGSEEPVCTKCGVYGERQKHGPHKSTVMHTPMRGKRVGIVMVRQRYKCLACGKTYLQHWEGGEIHPRRQITTALQGWIWSEVLETSFAQAARKIGIGETAVRDIFLEYADMLEAARQLVAPQWLGIDEVALMSLRRRWDRDRYQCLLTDVRTGRIVDLLPDRGDTTVGGALNGLRGKEGIEVVTMDMYPTYRMAAREVLPWADIVVDKFHVVRMAQNAVEGIRKADQKKLAPEARKMIKQERGLLLTHRAKVTDSGILRLDAWLNAMPRLKEVYLVKERFYSIYEAADKQEATERYDAWEASLTDFQARAFKQIIRAFTEWREETLNYWTHRATNAYTESMNNLLKLRKRQGRGYNFPAMRAIAVYGLIAKEFKPKFGEGLHTRGTATEDGLIEWPVLEGGQPISTFTDWLRAHGWTE